MFTARIEDAQGVRFFECVTVQYHHHGFMDFRGECIVVLDAPSGLCEIVDSGTVFIMNDTGQTVGRLTAPKKLS